MKKLYRQNADESSCPFPGDGVAMCNDCFPGIHMAPFDKRVLLIFLSFHSMVFHGIPGTAALASTPARAAGDTVLVSLNQAERLFERNNLRLVAAKYNVDAARAAILQGELWNNPTLVLEQNVYNQFTGKYFDVSSTGNTEVQIQQLFLLAGKRDKQIRFAEINAGIAEEALRDLLRALTYELRSDFYDLYYSRQSLVFYDESIASIKKTVQSVELVYEKRAVLLSEVLRLKSLLFSLEKDRLGYLNQIAETQADLRVLLNDSITMNPSILPTVDTEALDSLHAGAMPLPEIVATALDRRPDLRIAQESIRLAEANLALQQALGFPDVTIGGRWSRAGSYIPDYYAISLSVDLPLFNRNQGNIAAAEGTLEAGRRIMETVRQAVEKEVTTAYHKALEIDALAGKFDRTFAGDYRQLVQGMIANYEKRNISIIEFTDFFESYRNSMVQMVQLRNDRIRALETLNYVVGTNVIRP